MPSAGLRGSQVQPRVARRARWTAAASRVKSCPTRSRPRMRARRPPWRERVRQDGSIRNGRRHEHERGDVSIRAASRRRPRSGETSGLVARVLRTDRWLIRRPGALRASAGSWSLSCSPAESRRIAGPLAVTARTKWCTPRTRLSSCAPPCAVLTTRSRASSTRPSWSGPSTRRSCPQAPRDRSAPRRPRRRSRRARSRAPMARRSALGARGRRHPRQCAQVLQELARLDIAVAVSSGVPCLGAFDVAEPGGVLVHLARGLALGRQREHDLPIVVTHHARKNGPGGAQAGQGLRGSGDLHAWGDSNLYLRRSRDALALTVEHRAAAAPAPISLALVGDDDHAHLEIVDGDGDDGPAGVDLDAAVLAALAKAPLSRTALRAAVRARNERLGPDARPTRSRRPCRARRRQVGSRRPRRSRSAPCTRAGTERLAPSP